MHRREKTRRARSNESAEEGNKAGPTGREARLESSQKRVIPSIYSFDWNTGGATYIGVAGH